MTEQKSDLHQSLLETGQLPKLRRPPPMEEHLLKAKSEQMDFLDLQLLGHQPHRHSQDLKSWLAQHENSEFPPTPEKENNQSSSSSHQNSIDQLVQKVMGRLDAPPPQGHSKKAPKKSPTKESSITPLFTSEIAPFTDDFSSKVPILRELIQKLHQDLLLNKTKILNLNPSRRQHLLCYLHVLAATPSAAYYNETRNDEIKETLKSWINFPHNSSQESALTIYLEEVALVFLGQALLLKLWDCKKIRRWNPSDLGRLNWTLAKILSPHLPHGREGGWQITRSNLYSWYQPESQLLQEIFSRLDQWSFESEDPHFIPRILRACRQNIPNFPEVTHQYDHRFFQVLWKKIKSFTEDFESDQNPSLNRRKKRIFCPTLRDGMAMRSFNENYSLPLEWVGTEINPFQVVVLELGALWTGPSSPPLWSPGCGLGVHNREQLSIEWKSRKPTTETQIAEMEACDIGLVIEEKPVRTQGRSPQAAYFRAQMEKLPYFKKLKSSGTTLGDLQACVTLSKLRQGGLLLWLRSEKLSTEDGQAVLDFLLDRAKVICEWDLSQLQSSMPQSHPTTLPNHLYLLQYEGDLHKRHEHYPIQIRVQGKLQSHIEVPILLNDAFDAKDATPPSQEHGRQQWKIQRYKSPSPQREWSNRWPDPTDHQKTAALESLKNRSIILGSFATIRALKSNQQIADSQESMQLPPSICLSIVHEDGNCQVRTDVLPKRKLHIPESQIGRFIVTLPHQAWAAPIAEYLCSPIIKDWLDHFCETKKGKWLVQESSLKYVPIPSQLVKALRYADQHKKFPQDAPEFEQLLSEIIYNPDKVLQRLESEVSPLQKLLLFIHAAESLHKCRSEQDKLYDVVDDAGSIRWEEMMQILPENQKLVFSIHPQVRLSGNLPSHIPITKIEKPDSQGPFATDTSLTFSTDRGMQVTISCQDRALMDILRCQVLKLKHSTWGELTQMVYLPRELEFAHNMARQIIQFHESQQKKM